MNNFRKSNILISNFPEIKWKKSSFCGSSTCVEVAKIDGKFAIRDPKNIKQKELLFTKEEWYTFIKGVKNGEFE